MSQFAASLGDVGDHIGREYDARFLGLAEATSDIPAFAGNFAIWAAFADISTYEGRKVPFFKRAQLDPDLTAHIDGEELLDHGSPEEVELRAGAIHAVELLVAASDLTAAEIDGVLEPRLRSPLQVAPPTSLSESAVLSSTQAGGPG